MVIAGADVTVEAFKVALVRLEPLELGVNSLVMNTTLEVATSLKEKLVVGV